MKRPLVAAVSALVLSLAFCATAAAAPVLSFSEAKPDPVTVNRGDEIVGYLLKLTNTGTTETSAPIAISVDLPAGLELAYGSGSGWSCDIQAQSCTTVAKIAPGATLPQLRLQAWIFPALAPETIDAVFTASGGGAPDASAQASLQQGPEKVFEPIDFTATAEDPVGDDFTQAGGHPFSVTTSFTTPVHTTSLNQTSVDQGDVVPMENLRNGYFDAPAGLIGNPESIPHTCTLAEVSGSVCPEAAAAGGIKIEFAGQPSDQVALYRIFPGKGYPAAFAFRPIPVSTLTVVLRAKLRSNGDYGITAVAPLPPQAPPAIGADFATLCSYGAQVPSPNAYAGCKESGIQGSNEVPLLTNPTRCAGPPPVTLAHLDSFQSPARQTSEGFPDLSDPRWKNAEVVAPATTGCNLLEFEPTVEGRPTTSVADAPSGLDFKLHLPQEGLLDPDGLATPHLKDSKVTLPPGLVVNPSSAHGLEACSSAQIGLVTPIGQTPIRFRGLPHSCPDGSKLGNVRVDTPVLDKPLEGGVYLAKQGDNPFGSLLALYIAVEDAQTGISAKLAGKVTPDPVTGQITATFAENPQVPFEDLELDFFEGARGSLRTPAVCGVWSTVTELTPWSAPESGPPATLDDSFATTTAPGGGPCPTNAADLPNAPRFTAGTASPKAGAYSSFLLRLSRDDGSQELNGLNATLPPGLTGRLAGVTPCSDAQLARAIGRSKPGQGAFEQSNPSCPGSSEVGSVDIAAGAGPLPYHAQGRVYLAGPYKGAPISLAVITPAVAGPFDLGTVVVRSALYVDPKTAQVSVKSDPFPTILEGIPLDVRSIAVDVTRNQFILNPTSCNPMAIAATASGLSSAALLSERFQVGECGALGFKPNLKIQLHGGTRRGDYQRLVATVEPRPGDANIARAAVTLPHSSFLAQEHIRTVCTRVQFAAKACPSGSVYGSATALTPLLDGPVSGPVYLRSSNNPLPDLVAALRGPDATPIEVELSGRTDSKDGGIRNTFDLVPDAPVSKFTLQLRGGRRSLIVNSRDLCKGVQRATVRLNAQNGKVRNFRPVVGNDCRKKKGNAGQ